MVVCGAYLLASFYLLFAAQVPVVIPVGLAVAAVLVMVNPAVLVGILVLTALWYRELGAPISVLGFNVSQRDLILIGAAGAALALIKRRSINWKVVLPLALLLAFAYLQTMLAGRSVYAGSSEILLAVPVMAGTIIGSRLPPQYIWRVFNAAVYSQALFALLGFAYVVTLVDQPVHNAFFLLDGATPLSRVALDWVFGILIALVCCGLMPSPSTFKLILLVGGLMVSGTFTLIIATAGACAIGLALRHLVRRSRVRPLETRVQPTGYYRAGFRTFAVIFLGAALLAVLTPNLFSRFESSRLGSESIAYRESETSAVTDRIGARSIFGDGLGTEIVFLDNGRIVMKNDIHSSYWMVYWKAGIVGLTLYGIAILGFIASAQDRRRAHTRIVVCTYVLTASITVPILTTGSGLFLIGLLAATSSNPPRSKYLSRDTVGSAAQVKGGPGLRRQ